MKKNSAPKPTDDQAKNAIYNCLFCGERILVQKHRQGKGIALNENTLQRHDCPYVRQERSLLKMVDCSKDNNDNNTSKDERQPRQSSLLEFIQRNAANNESNRNDDGGNAIRPAKLIEMAEDGGLA